MPTLDLADQLKREHQSRSARATPAPIVNQPRLRPQARVTGTPVGATSRDASPPRLPQLPPQASTSRGKRGTGKKAWFTPGCLIPNAFVCINWIDFQFCTTKLNDLKLHHAGTMHKVPPVCQFLILAVIGYYRWYPWTFLHQQTALNHSFPMVVIPLNLAQWLLRYSPIFDMLPMVPICYLRSHGHFLLQFSFVFQGTISNRKRC